ncbi:MAG: hypothetical protein U9N85_12580 [Bacteroidota bacterium]|nr:hypothetical protein [Bacteroidota bacterium]
MRLQHVRLSYGNKFFCKKLNDIHQNPAKYLVVENPEDYLFSSARNYADLDSLTEVLSRLVWVISFDLCYFMLGLTFSNFKSPVTR